MANNTGAVYQQRTTQFHCKECGVYFDSAQSLDVHLQYHKENLLTKWANQAAATQQQQGGPVTASNNGEEANNNTTKIKRELITSSVVAQAPADSSDNTIVSSNKNNQPESPGPINPTGQHPATPQSYHSAPSPYQNEPSNFSPNFHHNFHIKTEDGISPPILSTFHPHYQNMQQYPEQPQFFDQHQLYAQDYLNNKMSSNNYHRYQPYQNPNAQVTSSSNNHSPNSYGTGQNTQPTPSPSPKQCDKCGFVCETAGQLIEHLQLAHPSAFTNQFQFTAGSNGNAKIKKEDGEPQAEILDLDSQKVHVYQTPEEQEQDALKRQQAELAALSGNAGGLHNPHPHSVTAMLSTWPPTNNPSTNPQKMFQTSPNTTTYDEASKMYNGMGGPDDGKMFSQEPKLFQPHQMHNSNNDYHNVSTTTHHDNPNLVPSHASYRPYEHIPVQPSPPVISSTQIVSNSSMPHQTNLPAPITTKGGANWKSNEARRPKTYNCSACNKWFTSSGHLKRHYNTTLHKNAVKSSGQPDPATLPISAHHHPSRDPNHHSNRQAQQAQQAQSQQQQHHDVNSQSPGASMGGHLPPTGNTGGSGDDTNSDENALGGSGAPTTYDSRGQHPGLLQQPPSGPYDRHPPNIANSLSPNLTNLSSGSPPNGEAGPSAITELSRGLQLQSTTINIPHQLSHLSPQHLSNIPQQISPTTNHHHQLLPPFNIINQQSMMDIIPTSSTQQGNNNPSIFHPITMGGPHHHHQISNYPNELSPHVTQPTMVVISNNSLQQPLPVSTTINHNSIGEYQHQEFGNMICTTNNGPLPSFAQFAMLTGGVIQQCNPLGVQINNSDVGGPSSVTDSTTDQSSYHMYTTSSSSAVETNTDESEFILPDLVDENAKISTTDNQSNFSPNTTTHHIIYHRSPDNNLYHQTVLQPVDQNIITQQQQQQQQQQQHPQTDSKMLMYSPTNNNFASSTFIHQNEVQHMIQNHHGLIEEDDSSPTRSSLSSHKSDEIENEMETSSPLITSTGSPLNVKRQHANQTNSNGNSGSGGIHKCIDCDKIFNKACYLTQHNKTFHSGDKPFKCNRCGKRFSDDNCYHTHLKKHAGDKPHKCEQCPKQFNHKTDLRRHMCLHSGYKPYACDTCGKGFIRKDHMVKHCDTHTRKSSKLKEQQTNNNNNSNNNTVSGSNTTIIGNGHFH